MTQAGVPRPIAKRISGHKTDAIFERYNIVNETDLREVMRKPQTFLQTWTVSTAQG